MIKAFFQQYAYLMADLKRWKCEGIRDYFYHFFEQGIWAVVFYRIGRSLFLLNIPVVKIVLRFIGFMLMKFSEVIFGISIPPAAAIGPGLYIGHAGGIYIHYQTVVGKNLNIGPGVILGEKGAGGKGTPTIGEHVYIGTGAKVLGDIHIGHNVKIGANAVVVKDVPDDATAVGVPARIIK